MTRESAKPNLDRHLNADLHCHSTASDGDLAPSEVVERAAQQGVEMLAITDHDNFDSLEEATQAAEGKLQYIAGIEFSSVWSGVGIHIVGLDFDPELLVDAVEKQKMSRQERTLKIAERLEKKGVKNALEGARHFAPSDIIGRPHFAKYLVSEGYFETETEAFKKWLGKGKIGDVKTSWPEIKTVVSHIKAAGGQAVLAHPHTYDLTNRKLGLLLEHFKACGGDGIEVSASGITPDKRQYFASLCERFQLMASRASDFHSPDNPWIELGRVAALPSTVVPIWQAFKSAVA